MRNSRFTDRRFTGLGAWPCVAAGCMAFLAGSLLSMGFVAVPARAALPEGRVYELVSPADKGSFSAEGPLVGTGGERIAFFGSGAFAGSPAGLAVGTGYLGSRGDEGWLTTPLAPPSVLSRLASLEAPDDFSPDLGLSVSVLDFAPEHSVSQSSQVFSCTVRARLMCS